MRKTRTPFMLLTLASLLFVLSYLLLILAKINPFIALIATILASLDINFVLISASLVSNPLVLVANFIDAFVFALMAVALAALFLEFIKQININRRVMLSKVKKLKQHIIIMPFNNFALSLAKELTAAGEKCVLVAENETDSHRAYRLGYLSVVGDPKNIEAFNISGIGQAKYVIACDDEDLQNALICVTAKSANARAKIIARVTDFENISKLGSAGAFRMMMPEVTVGTEIGKEIVKRLNSQA